MTKLSTKKGVLLVLPAGAILVIIYPFEIWKLGSSDAPIFTDSFRRPKRYFLGQTEESKVSKQQQSASQQTQLPAATLPEVLEVDEYELPGWPRNKSRSTSLYLRFKELTSLVEPVFPRKLNIFPLVGAKM